MMDDENIVRDLAREILSSIRYEVLHKVIKLSQRSHAKMWNLIHKPLVD